MSLLELNEFPAAIKQAYHKVIILVHGGALSYRMFQDVIPHLTSHGYDVFAPDLPGHGASVAAGPFTFERSTKLLLDAIETIRSRLSPDVKTKAEFLLVGVSLGGQAVLDVISHSPHHSSQECIKAALVASAPIRPPDDIAQWEMPHMPAEEKWLKIMTEDVNTMGMENAGAIQKESFEFHFSPPSTLPPMLVVVGENDVAMAKRDFDHLSQIAKDTNEKSDSMVLKGAWHNHPIDIPDRFARVILDWADRIFD